MTPNEPERQRASVGVIVCDVPAERAEDFLSELKRWVAHLGLRVGYGTHSLNRLFIQREVHHDEPQELRAPKPVPRCPVCKGWLQVVEDFDSGIRTTSCPNGCVTPIDARYKPAEAEPAKKPIVAQYEPVFASMFHTYRHGDDGPVGRVEGCPLCQQAVPTVPASNPNAVAFNAFVERYAKERKLGPYKDGGA